MKFKKIIHITGVRQLTSGQRQQLMSEHKASLRLSSVKWTTLVFHTGQPEESFEKRIPLLFRPLFLRNLYIWTKVLPYRKEYDFILLRHMTFDPFSLIFSYFIKNRISVHHAKEIEELRLIRKGWKGNLASLIEKVTGKISISNSVAIVGVTEEIAVYENNARGLDKKTFSYPNGIDLESINLAGDSREKNTINIVFICGTFSEWHGLDLLIKAVSNNKKLDDSFKVHLIGKLNNEDSEKIKGSNNFITHGVMDKEDYIKIIEKCDVGLGSLAMFRQNLNEGSTLKVREMLALGIPVYSTHTDTSIQDNSTFYLNDRELNIDNLIKFSLKMKKISRETVREKSHVFISKEEIMKKLLTDFNRDLNL